MEKLIGKGGWFIPWLFAAAAFLMIFWSGPVKLADIIFLSIGILLLFSRDARNFLKEAWPKFRPYAFYFFLILLFIALAQATSHIRGFNAIDGAVAKNYARVIFNAYTFFLAAFLVAFGKNNLRFISAAILASPIVILPAFWGTEEQLFLGGGRLTGLMQSPIIFGLWMMAVYLIGLGILLDAKNKAAKFTLFAWLSIIASFLLWAASRASWLALAAAIAFWALYYLFQKRNGRRAAHIVAIFMITFYLGFLLLPAGGRSDVSTKTFTAERIADTAKSLLTVRSPAHQTHFKTWSIVAGWLPGNPLGVGFGDRLTKYLGEIKASQDKNIPHSANNVFLEVAVYGGLGALLAFALFLLRLGAEIRSAIFTPSPKTLPHLRTAWLILAPAILIDIVFTDGFLLRHVWFVLGASLGAVIALDRRTADDATQETF